MYVVICSKTSTEQLPKITGPASATPTYVCYYAMQDVPLQSFCQEREGNGFREQLRCGAGT